MMNAELLSVVRIRASEDPIFPRLKMKMPLHSIWIFAFLGLFTGPHANADDGPLAYVRGDDAEFVLQPESEGKINLDLRVFGTVEQGRVVYGGGDLGKEAEDSWKEESEQERPDGKHAARILVLTGKPGDVTLRFKTAGVIGLISHAPIDASGEYKLVPTDELTRRAQKRFDAADALLNQRYKAVQAKLSEKKSGELKALQKQWIESRDYKAERVARELDEKATHNLDYWDEMHSLTVTRVEFLDAFSGKNVKPGLSGEFFDYHGGTLTLTPKQQGLGFTFEVVRGPTAHLGNVEGVAKFNADKSKAIWIDPENKECKISFTFSESRIAEVTEENTDDYHGARAYFSGTYYKVPTPKL